MMSGAGAVELAHEGGRHHVAGREAPAASRGLDITRLLEEACGVEGCADLQRTVAGGRGLDLQILGQPRSKAVAAEQRMHEHRNDAGRRAWRLTDAPGRNADHVRPHPGAIGPVPEQHVRVVRTAHEFGKRLHVGVRIVVLGTARECRLDDIARRRQMIDAQGADLHQGEETIWEGRTEHRRVDDPLSSEAAQRQRRRASPIIVARCASESERASHPVVASAPARFS